MMGVTVVAGCHDTEVHRMVQYTNRKSAGANMLWISVWNCNSNWLCG